MVSFAQFTSDFPEFASANQGQFAMWANVASFMLTPAWGAPAGPGQPNTQYDYGSELFIAHNLAIGMLNQQAAAKGGVPGMSGGVISGTTAGPLSVTYDASAGIEPDAGHWNLTNYGTRFIQMAMLIGAQPTQVSPGGCNNPLNGPAWTGNYPYPGYFG
jgi:hypothetical protein